jgi:hypothetical protein
MSIKTGETVRLRQSVSSKDSPEWAKTKVMFFFTFLNLMSPFFAEN